MKTHPGLHIREHIIPTTLSVTEAAQRVGVGRPALSNLLNGRSALSADMAERICRTFGGDATVLLHMQAEYDAGIALREGATSPVRAYVPAFLQIKAKDITPWADRIDARSRLAVLLRILIHSTCSQLTKVDFPGNDDSQRPGWDGFIESEEATPWIPLGESGWEFGTNKRIKTKADGDYNKSVIAMPAERRKRVTFVFVTPRQWAGKTAWVEERRAEDVWKDVRVFDASDLEQWLEQSIPAQVWLAEELEIPTQGVSTLEASWQNWVADCKPRLLPSLFDEAVKRTKEIITTKLSKSPPEPIIIKADSRCEALAFLHCALRDDDPELEALRNRIAVFSEPGPLAKLASKTARFIPVVMTPEVEREFAPHSSSLGGILVYPHNTTTAEAEVTLQPLGSQEFERALEQMGVSKEETERLSRESGRSRTVLRRRLSSLAAISTPEWASDPTNSARLVPFLFAGAWNSSNRADQVILSLLAGETPYSELEDRLARQLQIEDTPVWSLGPVRGVVSKLDTLLAANKSVTRSNLDLFLEVAKLVLSEDDPALDLPENQRFMADAFGKAREISSILRDGICETLVLLSVHGRWLFHERLGFDPTTEIGNFVKALLTPLTVRSLEAHSRDLPLYAEAAPDQFLTIIEEDLAHPESESLKLMRPASSDVFGSCPRTGLLWALENLAWSPDLLTRTVTVLARLAEPVIEDNWSNKPIESLRAIFRCWVPQTAASLENRIHALEHLVAHYPTTAWTICVDQFQRGPQVGTYSHKPRWSPHATGYGEGVSGRDRFTFAVRAFELALHWKQHSRKTIGDLVSIVSQLEPAHQRQTWDVIEQWSREVSDEDKAWMRDKVRVACMTRRGHRDQESSDESRAVARLAREVYDRLEPADIVLQYAWLFVHRHITESCDELEDDDLDWNEREERIERQRVEALRAIFADRGIEGLLALAKHGDGAELAGRLLHQILPRLEALLKTIRDLLALGRLADSPHVKGIVFGILRSVTSAELQRLLVELTQQADAKESVSLLILAPFEIATWHRVQGLGEQVAAAYWNEVMPGRANKHETDLEHATDQLLRAQRPCAAFHYASFHMQNLRPQHLFRILEGVPSSCAEELRSFRPEPYYIQKAFSTLNQSGEIPTEDMAKLEFLYLEVLDRHNDEDESTGCSPTPNLDRQIEKQPGLFAQAIALAYKREDDGEDPKEFRAADPDTVDDMARKMHTLLDRFSHLPGRNRHGVLESESLLNWVCQVREACTKIARGEICDFVIGKLFSKAPAGPDGVWPCEPVREVAEIIFSAGLSEGIRNGLYNARGVHVRGRGGDQEREIAEKYASWARALEYEAPGMSKTLRSMADRYEYEASQEDLTADIRRRL